MTGLLITVVQNVGVFALLTLAFMRVSHQRGSWPPLVQALAQGAMFGGASAISMLMPYQLQPGVIFDARGGAVLVAGIFGGPWASVVAAAIPMLARWQIGGVGAPAGVTTLMIYGGVSIVAFYLMRRLGRGPKMPCLLALGVFGTALGTLGLLMLPAEVPALPILAVAWPVLFGGNLGGIIVLSFLIQSELRREAMQEQLVEREREARVAVEAKSRFLAAMSHEIRTPMNGVVGFANVLLGTRLDDFQRRAAEQIRVASFSLLEIIDDILEYTRIQAGKLPINRSDVDLHELIRSCGELIAVQAAGKNLGFSFDVDDAVPRMVTIDAVRVRQVLINLLGNAVKFTDHGQVSLNCSFEPDPGGSSGQLRLLVRDTGIGMTEAELARLFVPFEQGQHIGRGGTGLGMTITRTLLDNMHGTVAVESVKGIGTSVTVALPVEIAAKREAAPAPAGTSVETTTRRLSILVAEDVAMSAEMLTVMLAQAGHAATIAANGREAVAAAAGGDFDLVLMDIQMPEMDGITATREIRALGGAAGRVPIVALTAFAEAEDRDRCLNAGMDDFLTKPVNRDLLMRTLARYAATPVAAPTPSLTAVSSAASG